MKNKIIEIHMIQNHSPANLNRDDLGAPKTCYFGGVLRSRISSQCLKRSIRKSEDFENLCGGIRTRRLIDLITEPLEGEKQKKKAKDVFAKLGIKTKAKSYDTDMLVYTTKDAVKKIRSLIQNEEYTVEDLKEPIKEIISTHVNVPDMALTGRMLETGEIPNTAVEAALQVAHAISTHEALPEIDYYVAVDDVPGEDAGAGYVDEAMYSSACFYKYFAIDYNQLVKNLSGDEKLAAKTIEAFILAAARNNPRGKQNSFAAHNYPAGILVEIKEMPFNYANAFIRPVEYIKGSDIITASINQLSGYIKAITEGYYDENDERTMLWFSPGRIHELEGLQVGVDYEHIASIGKLIEKVIEKIGLNRKEIEQIEPIGE